MFRWFKISLPSTLKLSFGCNILYYSVMIWQYVYNVFQIFSLNLELNHMKIWKVKYIYKLQNSIFSRVINNFSNHWIVVRFFFFKYPFSSLNSHIPNLKFSSNKSLISLVILINIERNAFFSIFWNWRIIHSCITFIDESSLKFKKHIMTINFKYHNGLCANI